MSKFIFGYGVSANAETTDKYLHPGQFNSIFQIRFYETIKRFTKLQIYLPRTWCSYFKLPGQAIKFGVAGHKSVDTFYGDVLV